MPLFPVKSIVRLGQQQNCLQTIVLCGAASVIYIWTKLKQEKYQSCVNMQ